MWRLNAHDVIPLLAHCMHVEATTTSLTEVWQGSIMPWRTCVHKNGCPPVEVEVLMAHWEIFSILSELSLLRKLGSASVVDSKHEH